MKEEAKNCVICKLPILIKSDRYLILDEFFKGKKETSFYYHGDCFKDKFLTQGKMVQSLDKMNRLMDQFIGGV